jgi:pimeloyl-ACP methyl ester carboxylesterase
MSTSPSAGEAAPSSGFPGTTTDWHGYTMHEFQLEGRACMIVSPAEVAAGRPWIWRARFFGVEPQTDLALLARGFHVAYIDVAGLLGAPEAVAIWDGFYTFLTEQHGLSKQPALEGFSRGGLIVYNWAIANPTRVSCIYADAPVCDIRSWPLGRGAGNGNPEMRARCLAVYGLSEDEIDGFTGNPIDNLASLAAAGVPLFHVCGDSDASVPFEENTAVLAERYRQLGGSIEVILKKDCAHHPHSLEDPTPIVDFILSHTLHST